jgi:hypothetical protein
MKTFKGSIKATQASTQTLVQSTLASLEVTVTPENTVTLKTQRLTRSDWLAATQTRETKVDLELELEAIALSRSHSELSISELLRIRAHLPPTPSNVCKLPPAMSSALLHPVARDILATFAKPARIKTSHELAHTQKSVFGHIQANRLGRKT